LPALVGAVNLYEIVLGPLMTVPTKIDVVAEESVYIATLCGMPLSALLKLMITWAPAATVILLLSKARPFDVRAMVIPGPELVGGLVVIEVTGVELVVGGIDVMGVEVTGVVGARDVVVAMLVAGGVDAVEEVEAVGDGVDDGVEEDEQATALRRTRPRPTIQNHFQNVNRFFI
jgi:hypothetical protein